MRILVFSSGALGLSTSLILISIMSTRKLYVAQRGEAVLWTIPKRDLRPNEVRVRIHSVGINQVDWKTIDNNFADGAGQGNDFSGVVVEVGSEVKTTKIGDTVAGGVGGGDVDQKENGSFTNLLSVEERFLFKFPHKLEGAGSDVVSGGIPKTFEQAASLGIAVDTNVLAFEGHENAKPSDWALVYGVTSSLGFVAAQFARNLGYNVIGVSAPNKDVTDLLEGVHWLDRNDPKWIQKARELANDNIVFAYDTIGLGNSPNETFKTLTTKTAATGAFSSPTAGPDEETTAANPTATVDFPVYFLLMQEVKKFGTTAMPNKTKPLERADELMAKVNAQLSKNLISSLPIKVLHGFDKLNEALDLNRRGIRGKRIVVNYE